MPIIGGMSALFDRKALTDEITLHLSIMQGVITWNTSRGHNDDAKILEDVIGRFLAALCGWKVINLNTLKKNYPAADLGVPTEGIAIQVTVNGTTDKVADVHAKAIAHKLSDDFHTLIILFLLDKAPADPSRSATFIRCTEPNIEKWDRHTLIARVDPQEGEDPAAHLARLRRCASVLRDEMTAVTHILSAPIRHTRHNLRYTSLGELFVGRADTLLAIRDSLTSGHTTALRGHAIHGMGGVGKTRASIEYAWQFLASYTHILMVDADTPGSLLSSIAGLCAPRLLDLPQHTNPDVNLQYDAVLQWLGNHRDWLLIMDNADTDDALAAATALLPALHTGHVLLTTRLTDLPPDFTAVPLDVISEDAAVSFLLKRTHGHRTATANDDARALHLARLLDGLCLALEQAAAYIRKTRTTFAEYITRWHTHTAEALAWHDASKMHYPRSLAVTYATSVAQLSEGAKALLRILAWFAPDPVPYSLLENESAPAAARAHLAELENLSLARRREDSSAFTLHRIVQEITRLQQQDSALDCGSPLPLSDGAAGPGAETRGATEDAGTGSPLPSPPPADAAVPERQRAAAVQNPAAPPALLTALQWVNEEMPFDTDDVRTWPVAIPLLPHALATAHAAAARDLPPPTGRLLNHCALLEKTRANHRTAEPLYRTALALTEKHSGENHPDTAPYLNNLAQLLQATNRLAEAEPLMRRALTIDEASFGNDHPNVARDLNNLALLLQATNRLAEAEPLMRRALAIDEASFGKDHPNIAIRLNNLASLLKATNRLAEAEPLMRRGLAIWEDSLGKHHPNVAAALNNLAQLLQATNRLAEAEPLMRRALAIDEASFGKEHPNVAIRLNNLALLLQATNHLAEAEPLMRRHLEIFINFTVQTGHPHPHLNDAINNYGGLLMEMGDTKAVAREKIGKMVETIVQMRRS